MKIVKNIERKESIYVFSTRPDLGLVFPSIMCTPFFNSPYIFVSLNCFLYSDEKDSQNIIFPDPKSSAVMLGDVNPSSEERRKRGVQGSRKKKFF